MPAPRTAKPHWLRPVKTCWSPDSVISFDTETRESTDGDDFVLSLRCWSAKWRLRHDVLPTLPRTVLRHGTEIGDLVTFVEDVTDTQTETWVYAHNLAFDLTVTALPLYLVYRGWEIDAFLIGQESTWWKLSRDGRRIILTDSWSWVRCSLEEAAKEMGRRKRKLPDNEDDLETWYKRCDRDVDLLDQALSTLMDWWDDNDVGRWQVTGAGCGWSAARHLLAPKSILVGYDADRTPMERDAIHGGRHEVYHVGYFKGFLIADYDFKSAYLRIASHYPLPSRPMYKFSHMTTDKFSALPDTTGIVAEVTVSTLEPVVPCRIGTETWWPTGRFKTTLCSPEIAYALDRGATVDIGRGYAYHLSYALKDWADWNLAVLADNDEDSPPLVRRMAKHWGRAVIGRTAAHTSNVIATRPADTAGWSLMTGRDLTSDTDLDVLCIAGTEYEIAKDQEAADSSPIIFAWVESHCRADLGRALDKRPQGSLLQCNTDGWLEGRVSRDGAEVIAGDWGPHVLVRKGLWREGLVLGPSHVSLPGERRFAGIPRKAGTTDTGAIAWHSWPSLRWQLERSQLGIYRRPPREVDLSEQIAKRWLLEGGETIAPTVSIGESGENELQPWSSTWGRMVRDTLLPEQHERLSPLADVDTAPPCIFDDMHLDSRGRRWTITVSKGKRGKQPTL